MSLTSAAVEAFWPRRILEDLRQRQFFSTTMFCENMSTIALTKNLVFHNRTEYNIELRHCYIRELMRKTAIELHFCRKNIWQMSSPNQLLQRSSFISETNWEL
jgi:hypothetical protein